MFLFSTDMENFFFFILFTLLAAEICYAVGFFSWGERPKLERRLMWIGTSLAVVAIVGMILLFLIDVK